MIHIERIALREIHLPLKEPFRISSGVEETRRILLVQVEDGDGVTTWSECVAGAAPNYAPETIDHAWVTLRQWIAPRVLGRDFDSPQDLHAALEVDFRGHRMAKASIEMAAWCLVATRASISLAEAIGAPAERNTIPVGISLGIQDTPQALVEKARAALQQGYRKIKIKIKPGFDVEYIRAVREALGPDAPLMADANNAYALDDLDTLRQLDAFGLIMIEQPLAWDDLVRHATLQKHLSTPVCLDESITSVERAEDMIALKSGAVINIKPGRVGGFTESIGIHDRCARAGIPVWCGGMLESGIGRAYNVALASLPNFTLPGDVSPSARYWARDVVKPEWTMSADGLVRVPRDRVGLGVDVDVDFIDDLTTRQELLRA
jgi:o-succinylbenzoate synthase